jgi:hypothetical protein
MSKTRNFSNNLIDLLLINISVTNISIIKIIRLFYLIIPITIVTSPVESVSNVAEVRMKKRPVSSREYSKFKYRYCNFFRHISNFVFSNNLLDALTGIITKKKSILRYICGS